MRRLMLIGSPMAGAGLALLVVACAGIGPWRMPAPKWVECEVQETVDSDTATIVADVPRVLTLDGGHTLEIPANAVEPGTRIRFTQLPTFGVDVRVTPASLELSPAATMTLSYEGRGCEIEQPSGLAVFWKGTNVDPPEKLPPPTTTPPAGSVAGLVDHFSLFAIAR